MGELEKAIGFGLHGAEAEKYLAKFRRQAEIWGAAMPSAEPLVSDFCLGDFERAGLIELWIANEIEAGYCGKYLFVFDGQSCPMHFHKEKLETFFVVKGKTRMTYNGKTFEMGPGDTLKVEREKYHSFTGLGPALLLEVSTPCMVDDNYFQDTRIPIGGNYFGAATKNEY
jgi:mannose-6-phosphate isomerase-like protein (cupin superfamily)